LGGRDLERRRAEEAMSQGTEPRIARRQDLRAFYTTEEVAEVFVVKPKTVRRWIDHGEIQATKLHSQWRVPVSEVERLLEECRRA
jgi:excisionase family DNA binding protein